MKVKAKLHHIYLLRDPRDKAIRYVGVTCISLAKRCAGHIHRAKGPDTNHRCTWLRSLAGLNLRPLIELVETVPTEWRVEREQHWIRHYREQGCRLTNATEGGEGTLGYRLPPEAIERMRAKKTGRKNGPPSEETRQKIAAGNRGRPLSPEHRKKLSDSHKGFIPSAVARQKLSLANKGRQHTEETLTKMRKPKTEQHRRNAAAALQQARATGRCKPACGDANGLRKHPESALRGENNPIAKLTADQVREMRRRYVPHQVSTVQLAKEYGISQGTCWNIIHGNTWKHLL